MLANVRGVGPCSICGEEISFGAAFINVGSTDWHDPEKPKSARWVPIDEDIHGWSPFVSEHPACYAHQEGLDELLRLVDESHRLLRRQTRD